MKHVKPVYYDDFICTGGSCPHTCCAGWQVGIDPASLERYASLRGEFGYEVKNAIDWMEDCFLQDDRGCLLLREDGLCRIQCRMGEAALCDTCRTFPRHVEEFPGLREYSLSLSCPAAAELVMAGEPGADFLQEETREEEEIEFDDFDEKAFADLLFLREKLRRIIQKEKSWEDCRREVLKAGDLKQEAGSRKRTAKDRMESTKGIGENLRDWHESFRLRMKLLEKLIPVDSSWGQVSSRMREGLRMHPEDPDAETDRFLPEDIDHILRSILWAMVSVQLPGAVYEGTAQSKTALAVFFADAVRDMALVYSMQNGKPVTKSELTMMTAILDRQLEHDDDNLISLEEALRI